MDDKKDIQSDRYSKGPISGKDVLENGLEIAPFQQDPFFLYALRKSERIAAAAYLVTRAASKDDPVTISIRSCATLLVSNVATFSLVPGTERDRLASEIRATLIELASHLSVAVSAAFVSQNNKDILGNECLEFSNSLAQHMRIGPVLEKSFLEPRADSFSGLEYKGHKIKDKKSVKIAADSSGVVSRTSEARSERHGERRETILNLVRERGAVSVRDFLSTLPSVSAKTIQRELLYLVAEGTLKKEGERRWSKYSLQA